MKKLIALITVLILLASCSKNDSTNNPADTTPTLQASLLIDGSSVPMNRASGYISSASGLEEVCPTNWQAKFPNRMRGNTYSLTGYGANDTLSITIGALGTNSQAKDNLERILLSLKQMTYLWSDTVYVEAKYSNKTTKYSNRRVVINCGGSKSYFPYTNSDYIKIDELRKDTNIGDVNQTLIKSCSFSFNVKTSDEIQTKTISGQFFYK